MPHIIDWTAERIDELRAVMADGASYREAHRTLSERWALPLTPTMVRQACQRYDITSSATLASVQARRFQQYTDCWTLAGDWLICGDLQLPFVDVGLCEELTKTARRLHVRQLLIVGDVFDFERLGPYAAVAPEPDVIAEGRLARAVMDEWLRWFQDVRVLTGNHDIRLAKALEGAVETEDICGMLASRLGDSDRVHWSVYGYALIDSPSGTWRATHPRNYSRLPLAVAGQLATRHRTHVITFHEHQTGIAFDRSGQSIIVNCGCMADPTKLAYRMLSDSTHPEQTQSYAALVEGHVRLYSPHPGWWV